MACSLDNGCDYLQYRSNRDVGDKMDLLNAKVDYLLKVNRSMDDNLAKIRDLVSYVGWCLFLPVLVYCFKLAFTFLPVQWKVRMLTGAVSITSRILRFILSLRSTNEAEIPLRDYACPQEPAHNLVDVESGIGNPSYLGSPRRPEYQDTSLD